MDVVVVAAMVPVLSRSWSLMMMMASAACSSACYVLMKIEDGKIMTPVSYFSRKSSTGWVSDLIKVVASANTVERQTTSV